MRVAITGATGLLGANLAAVCREAGHDVVAVRRGSSRTDAVDDLDLRWAEASLSDPEALARAYDGAEVVFHCAAAVSVLPRATPGLIAANVDGTMNVLAAVRSAGVRRLVHTSSTVTVGISEDGSPCDERHDWNLARHGLADGYAVTKRQSEELVAAAVAGGAVDAVIVNPGFLFGPRDARPSSGTLILEVGAGRAWVASPGRNCFVDVRDVARGMLAASERGRSGERYILAGENLTYGEVFARVAAVVGRRPPRLSAPRSLAALVGLGGDLRQAITGREGAVTTNTVRWAYEPGFVFSSDKARRELGYTTGPLDRAIADAWAWFREHGMARRRREG